MKNALRSLVAACVAALLPWGAATAGTALLPQPQSAQIGEPVLALTGAFTVEWSKCGGDRLQRAAARFSADMLRRTGVEPGAARPVKLRIACADGADTADADEAYRLRVDAGGIDIAADGPAGVLRGLATLRQLAVQSGDGFALPSAEITDAPRFVWRGLMIDVVRHFITLETLKRQIDAMELVKLNVLHLHLTDNEGFRIESRVYPKLTAGSDGRFYTQAQMRELIAYAADRGVRIVPEIDVPGHAKAILQAYPELAVPAKLANRAAWDNPLNSPALNPASEQTYQFLARLFEEMAALFPDPYFHVGGDEVPDNAWDDPDVATFMKQQGLASKAALESYFHTRVHAILRRHGKTVIGWDEVVHEGVPTEIVAQVWRGSKQIARATARGHRVIVSAGYYLNLLSSAEEHYAIDPLDPTADGLTVAQRDQLYKVLPMLAQLFAHDAGVIDPELRLEPGAQALVLGGEGPLWTELVTDEMVDGLFWPRAAALAERFWSSAEVRDVGELYRRLAVVQDQLRVLGLQDAANRQRMVARLAPGDTQTVQTLLDALESARNTTIPQLVRKLLQGQPLQPIGPFNRLADAAYADNLMTQQLRRDVDAYLNGETALAPTLRARLAGWRDNHMPFAKAAQGRPLLAAALPVSADVAALAEAGLAALAAIEARQPLSQEVRRRAGELLERQAQARAVAAPNMLGLLADAAPPTENLLIAIAPAIAALVDAAGNR